MLILSLLTNAATYAAKAPPADAISGVTLDYIDQIGAQTYAMSSTTINHEGTYWQIGVAVKSKKDKKSKKDQKRC